MLICLFSFFVLFKNAFFLLQRMLKTKNSKRFANFKGNALYRRETRIIINKLFFPQTSKKTFLKFKKTSFYGKIALTYIRTNKNIST